MEKKNIQNVEGLCLYYRNGIMETVKRIDDPVILMKIYTVARTHLEIQMKKEQEG